MIGFSEDPAPFGAKLGKDAFLAWVQRQDGGRYELKDGHIVMHAGSTRAHAQICIAFGTAFRTSLERESWAVTVADFAVEVGDDIRYPDVLVEAAGSSAPDASSTRHAVLLVEVLSPSSASRDLNLKLAEYTSLPSLQCYVVASQDEAIVWVWQRQPETGAFPAQPEEIAGPEAAIAIPARSLSLPLADIYRGTLPGRP